MNNAFVAKLTTVTVPIKTTKKKKKNIHTVIDYYHRELMTTNNFTFCKDTNCGVEELPVTKPINNARLPARILSTTFESINKNLGSYSNTVDMTNKKIIRKTYSLPDDKEILVVSDLRDKNRMVKKITGATGYDFTLVRITIRKNGMLTNIYETED